MKMAKCKECGQNIRKSRTVIVDGVEYTTEDEQLDVSYKDIKIPKGWRLWEPEEAVKLHKNKRLREKLNLNDCWFFVESKHYLPEFVAGFDVDSDRAYLSCSRYPQGSNSKLGVRFCRKLKEQGK